MIETLQEISRKVSGTGVKTQPTNRTVNRVTLDREGTVVETRDVERHGDHVTALPYWSERVATTISSQKAVLTGFLADIYVSSPPANGTFELDWPWPRRPIYPKSNIYSTAHANVWSFDASAFIRPTTPALPSGTAEEWDTLVKLADTKALGNARKALANLPMIFKERRETISMIGGKVQSMAKSARALQAGSLEEYRKTKPKNRKAVAKRISNEHLEFVFGWLPVIGEVEGLVDYIERDNLDFIRSRGIQAFAKPRTISETTVKVGPWVRTTYFDNNWGTMTTTNSLRELISVRTALRYKLTTKVAGDAYMLGFEPLGTGFDLIPLSFISGWISNFDYWIRTISPLVGMEFETGSRNRRRHAETQSSATYSRRINGRQRYIGNVEPVYASWVMTRDEREVLLAEPLASLDWDVEVGLYEVAAGISLTLQRYLKPLKRQIAVKQFRYKGPRPKWLKEIRYTGRK